MAMSVMPSPRCSFNVKGALSFVPSTWKPEGALVCGFGGAGVTDRRTDAAGLGNVVVGVLGVLLAGVLDLGMVAVFGLVLVAGLDPALGSDGDLALRPTFPVPDLVALLLVFDAALDFGAVFVFFLATMRAPASAPYDSQPCRMPTPTNPKHNQGRSTGWN
jgi:hypothetical protein